MATPGGGFDPAGGGPVQPSSPSGGGSGTSVGMAANTAACLCYVPLCCLNVVWAIYVVIAEKQSRFLRFHAFQSLLLAAVFVVCAIFVQIVGFVSGMLSMLLSFVLGLGCLGAAIFMAVKAYGNEEFELPVIGPMAKQWS